MMRRLLPLAALAARYSAGHPGSPMLSSLTLLLRCWSSRRIRTMRHSAAPVSFNGSSQRGGRASIVWITSGDGSELDLLVIEKSLRIDPTKLRALGGAAAWRKRARPP